MPFAPGQSGNPGGRSKSEKLFRAALVVALKRADAQGVEAMQRLADRMVEDGLSGNTQAQALIMDRIDGKVPQGHGGAEDLPDIKQRIEFSWQTAASKES